jgi:hypothetical protein
VPNDAAHLAWAVNLGNIDWNPWPVRRDDLDHPDELRVDLDPTPSVAWSEVREVALCAGDVLREHAIEGFPKTSGSRGPGHVEVVEGGARRRVPRLQPEARDRTVASAHSVRAVPDARVSTPLRWDEVAAVEPGDLRLDTVPWRLAEIGDPAAAIDDVHHSLEPLLDLARRDEEEGLGDAVAAALRQAGGRAAPRAAQSLARGRLVRTDPGCSASPSGAEPGRRRPASPAGDVPRAVLGRDAGRQRGQARRACAAWWRATRARVPHAGPHQRWSGRCGVKN